MRPLKRKPVAAAAGILILVTLLAVPVFRCSLLSLGCRAGLGTACAKLGEYYFFTVYPPSAKALPPLQRGCELDNMDACAAYLEYTTAVSRDFAKAEGLCLRGGPAFGLGCLHMAINAVTGGYGDYQRIERAHAFYGRACFLGLKRACELERSVEQQARDVDESSKVAEACARGDQTACNTMWKEMSR